jgi:acyl-coenzyme A synthetase/AMP-(fatty) acid ligase
MKPTSLKQAFEHVDAAALITPQGVTPFVRLMQSRWTGVGAASVVVFCTDLSNTLRAMTALDGAVDAFCAMPTTLGVDDLAALLGQWPFDTVITDGGADTQGMFAAHGLTCMNMEDALTNDGAAQGERATKWLVPTSGTTSTPKLVIHSFDSLSRTALAGRKITDPPQLWAMLYDVTRFAGYQVFLQAALSGQTLAFAGLDTPMDQRVSFFARHGVTHISATPTLWRKILMCPASAELSPAQITLGGEVADQATLSSLGAKYPRARVTHIFASTEAGVGLAVSDGRAGFPLSYIEKPFNGVEISLMDGRLHVRVATRPSGYAGEAPLADRDGWIDTGDLVHVDGDRFFVIGRESGIINVGGDKVVPELVRDALLACDIVHEAVVYGKKNPFTGALVAADVVLTREMDKDDARKIIDGFLAQRLTAPQRPRLLRFVPEIKANATGKVATKS